jgi:SAM-dependent methyltransferase
MDMPTRMNLGSGKSFDPAMLNVDINGYWKPDVLVDLSARLDHSREFDTKRFGPLRLEPGRFDAIRAIDVLEHVGNLVTLMTNCLALLRVGGTFNIKVPYDLSYGAWQDPTHVRAFNENSWLYYTEWFWYLGWSEARFEVVTLSFDLHRVGQEMSTAGQPLDLVLRTPRAVDAMDVVLRKRALDAGEKSRVDTYLARDGGG